MWIQKYVIVFCKSMSMGDFFFTGLLLKEQGPNEPSPTETEQRSPTNGPKLKANTLDHKPKGETR